MADLIVLAQSIPMKAAGGSSFYQDIKDAVDISAYDSIDFSVNLVSDHSDGAATRPTSPPRCSRSGWGSWVMRPVVAVVEAAA